jgi:hypothetical protein
MFQVMIVSKISTGTHLAVTSQLAQCDTKEQADALCDGVEKQNKESRALSPDSPSRPSNCTRLRSLHFLIEWPRWITVP